MKQDESVVLEGGIQKQDETTDIEDVAQESLDLVLITSRVALQETGSANDLSTQYPVQNFIAVQESGGQDIIVVSSDEELENEDGDSDGEKHPRTSIQV
jgi:hypothetical protein